MARRLPLVFPFSLYFGGLVLGIGFNAQAQDAALTKRAAEIRAERAEPLMSVMNQAVTYPGEVGNTVREALKERDEVLFNQSKPLPDSVKKTRTIIAPLFKVESTRKLLVSLANNEITSMSDKIKSQLLSNNERLNVDEIIIGMGPQGAAYAQEKTSRDPNRLVLMVDQAKRPGGTFANVDAAFALNSTNRKDTGERAEIGKGDLNKVTDIVGLPDFNAQRWVEAGKLGEITSMGVLLSSAMPLVQTEVLQVNDNNNNNNGRGPRYLVSLRDKVSGREFSVGTDKIVFASGLGTPKSFGEAGTDALIDRERASAERARSIPKIETFTQFINRAGDTENRKPIRDLVDKNVLLIGGGDSGRVIAELLTGLGPTDAYKSDVGQIGQVKKIYWFVGYDGFTKCKEFVDSSRARYSRIAQALNSGVLVPVAGRVKSIVDAQDTGKFDIIYDYVQQKNGARTSVNAGEPITFIQPRDPRLGREEGLASERISFDKVIVATGFDNRIPEVIRPFNPSNRPFTELWKPLDVETSGFNGKTVSVANELKDRFGIFLIGPANEDLGGLPKADELKGINENTVSLFANVERSKGLADFLAVSPVTDYRDGEARLLRELQLSKAAPLGLLSGESPNSQSVAVNNDQIGKRLNVESSDLALRVALDRTLKSYSIDPKAGELKLEIIKSAGGYQVVSKLDPSSAQDVAKALGENALLNNLLMREFLTSETGIKSLDIRIPIRASGQLSLSDMSITPRRR